MKCFIRSLLLISLFFAPERSTLAADDKGLGPGDKGFRHDEFHDLYQEFFDEGRCYCGVGECRPTIYRQNPDTPSGYSVKINGNYYPVPEEAVLKGGVPPKLWRAPAHVCAYPNLEGNGYVIECFTITAGW